MTTKETPSQSALASADTAQQDAAAAAATAAAPLHVAAPGDILATANVLPKDPTE